MIMACHFNDYLLIPGVTGCPHVLRMAVIMHRKHSDEKSNCAEECFWALPVQYISGDFLREIEHTPLPSLSLSMLISTSICKMDLSYFHSGYCPSCEYDANTGAFPITARHGTVSHKYGNLRSDMDFGNWCLGSPKCDCAHSYYINSIKNK